MAERAATYWRAALPGEYRLHDAPDSNTSAALSAARVRTHQSMALFKGPVFERVKTAAFTSWKERHAVVRGRELVIGASARDERVAFTVDLRQATVAAGSYCAGWRAAQN